MDVGGLEGRLVCCDLTKNGAGQSGRGQLFGQLATAIRTKRIEALCCPSKCVGCFEFSDVAPVAQKARWQVFHETCSTAIRTQAFDAVWPSAVPGRDRFKLPADLDLSEPPYRFLPAITKSCQFGPEGAQSPRGENQISKIPYGIPNAVLPVKNSLQDPCMRTTSSWAVCC